MIRKRCKTSKKSRRNPLEMQLPELEVSSRGQALQCGTEKGHKMSLWSQRSMIRKRCKTSKKSRRNPLEMQLPELEVSSRGQALQCGTEKGHKISLRKWQQSHVQREDRSTTSRSRQSAIPRR